MTIEQHCPHCFTSIGTAAEKLPARDARCVTCRLVIGAGRGLDAASVASSGRSSTLGHLVRSASRRERVAALPEADVIQAIARVAREVGVRPDRLRITDFDEAARRDETLPTVAQVLATFGTWKRVRRTVSLEGRYPRGPSAAGR